MLIFPSSWSTVTESGQNQSVVSLELVHLSGYSTLRGESRHYNGKPSEALRWPGERRILWCGKNREQTSSRMGPLLKFQRNGFRLSDFLFSSIMLIYINGEIFFILSPWVSISFWELKNTLLLSLFLNTWRRSFHECASTASWRHHQKGFPPFVKDKMLSSQQLYPKLRCSTLMGNSFQATLQLEPFLLSMPH